MARADILLKEVGQAFASLASSLTALIERKELEANSLEANSLEALELEAIVSYCKANPEAIASLAPSLTALIERKELAANKEAIVRRLLLLELRSRDVLNEFAEFYCLRLLLDEQSPLATYFIDFFSQLQWLLQKLSAIHSGEVRPFLTLLQPVVNTCRLLYVAYRMLPRTQTLEELQNGQREVFQREGKQGRGFSRNGFHCLTRQLGFVNLDQPGQSMVSLKERLGEGAFATVYKGVFELDGPGSEKDKKMTIGDPVAVKMFADRIDGVGDESGSSFGSRLLQSMQHMTQDISSHQQRVIHDLGAPKDDPLTVELQMLVSVRHPNIVTPRGYIGKRPQGESGLVMEKMDESLHNYLEEVSLGRVPPLTELDMLDLMLEIAKGMRFLHECNLMHRDLKPKNVLLRFLSNPGMRHKIFEVKLADFGLTKLWVTAEEGSMCNHSAFLGTTCYMAPEIRADALHGLRYDEKVDVFSFGTTCFNILVGNPDALAFSQSSTAFYEDVKTGRWKEWVQGIDKHLLYLVTLIARCWESNPTVRPTFATLCLLLQHAMQWLLSPASLHTAIFATQDSELPVFEQWKKLRYSDVCWSLMQDFYSWGSGFVGLKVITECFKEFEESARNRSLIHLGDGYTSDMDRDVSNIVEARRRKGHFNGYGSGYIKWKKQVKLTRRQADAFLCELMGKPDPLIFFKGLACYNVERHSYHGDREVPLAFYKSQFSFKGDEAYSELQVDTSLIALLLGFWLIHGRVMQPARKGKRRFPLEFPEFM